MNNTRVKTMSAQHSYQNVRTVLFEDDSDVRQTIKSTLAQDTFIQTIATSTLKTAQSAIFNGEADLMIVDIDGDNDEVCALMWKIRHNRIGENPFPVSIALSNNSNFRHVRQAVDSGFDVMLLKPFSMTKLLDRVHHLMQHRPPFAVTSDYIGPDRRRPERNNGNRGTNKLITVPNPLAIMASGGVSVPQMKQAIKEGITVVNERRVQANGEKANEIIEELASRYLLGKLDEKFGHGLKRLNIIGKDMNRRLRRSKFSHVAELCDTMHTVVSRMLEAPLKPEVKDMELLQNLGNAIDRAFRAKASEIMTAHSISDSIRATA